MTSRNLIEDPRTIYSLAMIIILYEAYKSDFLASENPLIIIIKIGLLILISTQLIFLYLCGLSETKLKTKEFKEKLAEIANDIYTIGFQYSFFIFFLNISFGLIYYYFKGNSYLFTLWGKILLIIITFIIAIGTIKIREKYFEHLEDDNSLIYTLIGFWVFFITLFIGFNINW
jgi:hypothetical protein